MRTVLGQQLDAQPIPPDEGDMVKIRTWVNSGPLIRKHVNVTTNLWSHLLILGFSFDHLHTVIRVEDLERHEEELARIYFVKLFLSSGKVDTCKSLDASLVNTASSGTELVEHDISSKSGNDAHADDADIRPIYDEEPMAEVQSCNPKKEGLKVGSEKNRNLRNQAFKEFSHTDAKQ
ncbi:hypothetical protein Tco_1033306 [Tanacetum coccineum]|uniref:DUF4283 domain-containing protein n=1 Tax=Tanacetum coccineum TaxID=301880 RepID=A0ABQ5GEU9_9ASTR